MTVQMLKATFMVILLNCVKAYDDPLRPTLRDKKQLIDKLMGNYSKHVLPVNRWLDSVNVRLEVDLLAVGEIDEVEERLSTVMWFYYQWTDENFQWNISDINVVYLTLAWMDVWKPVLRVINPHTDSLNKHTNDRAYESVFYTFLGDAFFDEMVVTKTTCDLDLTYYPFDVHTCFINMSIVGAKKYSVNLLAAFNENYTVNGGQHGLWRLLDYRIFSNSGFMDIELTFERRPLFLVLNILMPIIVVAFLTPIVFILPKKSGERVGFSITMLLALSVYMTIVSDHLPRNSDPIPLILILMIIWYLIDAAIVLIVILNTKISMFKDVSPLPTAIRKFVHVTHVVFRQKRKSARETIPTNHELEQPNNTEIVASGKTNEDDVTTDEKYQHESNDVTNTQQGNSDDVMTTSLTWKEVSSCIDRWCFVACYFIKIVLPLVFITALKHGNN